MNWRTRLRLLIGLVLVLGLVAVLTVQVNNRRGQAISQSATLQTERVSVGTDFAGVVTRQLVHSGDAVTAGQVLFEIDSAELAARTAAGQPVPTAAYFDIVGGRSVRIKATAAGNVGSIEFAEGAFVPSNTVLAWVDRTDARYVDATFKLSAGDYARLPRDAAVMILLPSGQEVAARVADVSVQGIGGEALTVIRADGPALSQATDASIFAPGTPVSARLTLKNDNFVTRAAAAVKGFLGGLF
jgi:multidrug resistance efflux pump